MGIGRLCEGVSLVVLDLRRMMLQGKAFKGRTLGGAKGVGIKKNISCHNAKRFRLPGKRVPRALKRSPMTKEGGVRCVNIVLECELAEIGEQR